jgi:hypothetical protein
MPGKFEIPQLLSPFNESIPSELNIPQYNQESVVVTLQSQTERVRLMEELAPQYGLMIKIVGQPGDTVIDHNNNLQWPVAEDNLGVRISIPRGVSPSSFYEEVEKRMTQRTDQDTK